jgi:hypothetical protein
LLGVSRWFEGELLVVLVECGFKLIETGAASSGDYQLAGLVRQDALMLIQRDRFALYLSSIKGFAVTSADHERRFSMTRINNLLTQLFGFVVAN